MRKNAGRGGRALAGATMRPRRWYTHEVAAQERAVRLTSQTWRYRSLVRRRLAIAAETSRPAPAPLASAAWRTRPRLVEAA